MSLFCQNKLSLIIYWGTILEPLWIRKAVEKINLKTQFFVPLLLLMESVCALQGFNFGTPY